MSPHTIPPGTIAALLEMSPTFEQAMRNTVHAVAEWATANEAFLDKFAGIPYAPRREPGRTARQYRAARRQYGRDVRAWRRSFR